MPKGSFSITFEAEDAAGNKTKKIWTITIKGTEVDEKNLIFVKKEIEEEVEIEKEELEPIIAWIESLDKVGNLEIRFSVPVLAVENVSEVQRNDFNIILKQMSNEKDQSEQFKFNVTESTPQGLKCKLTFEDALSISTGEIEDRIYVYMRREVFMNRDTEDWHKTYTNPYEVIELTEEEKAAELLKADQEEIKTAEDLEKEKA